jgi:hypothetical protein
LVTAFRTATLKKAKSLHNFCLCMCAMRLQLCHGRRWLLKRREVRATFSAPFDDNEWSWPLRKRRHVHANLLGGLTVDVALDHHYRSTRSLSSLRLARERVMTLNIYTGACDVASCVRLRDLASNRGGRAVGRDNRSTPLAFFHDTTGSLRRVSCAAVRLCAGPRVELRWTDGATWSLNQRRVRCVAELVVVVAAAALVDGVSCCVGGGSGCGSRSD